MTTHSELLKTAFYHRGHRGHRERSGNVTREELNVTTGQVVDAAIKVHSALGPGLLESAYKACLAYELRKRGYVVATEVPVPIVYDGLTIDLGYNLDLLVEGAVVTEAKAIAKVLPVHEAQLLSHLKLGNYPVGLLINFHCRRLKQGITRLAN
jgi:GxxExxY protein